MKKCSKETAKTSAEQMGVRNWWRLKWVEVTGEHNPKDMDVEIPEESRINPLC
jgi:hypothetical protein